MAGETPSITPSDIRAGDTAKWRREFDDYLATEGWVLGYTLVGAGAVYSVTAVADGSDFTVDVPAATTAGWLPGAYRLHEYVSRGAERYTVSVGTLRVLQNLASLTSGADLRTHARKVLDSIEAWLESQAPVAGAVEIAGRKIAHYPITDLLALRDRYRAEVRREESAPAGGNGSRLYVRL